MFIDTSAQPDVFNKQLCLLLEIGGISPHWEITPVQMLDINKSRQQIIFDMIEELCANTQAARCFHSVGRINGNHKQRVRPMKDTSRRSLFNNMSVFT